MKKESIVRPLSLITLLAFVFISFPVVAAQSVESDWQAQFEELASPAGGAMELPADQLESLLARCKALKEKLPVLDESARKVYGRRLQMTCDLYQFMLDSKRAAAETENPKQ
jgi:hypothetical protein